MNHDEGRGGWLASILSYSGESSVLSMAFILPHLRLRQHCGPRGGKNIRLKERELRKATFGHHIATLSSQRLLYARPQSDVDGQVLKGQDPERRREKDTGDIGDIMGT